MRGKDYDSFEWTYLEKAENTVVTECENDDDICTYFPVGFVPFIKFNMYDVAIEILPSDSLSAFKEARVDFHIAYFNPNYTFDQLMLKMLFSSMTFMIIALYSARIIWLLAFQNANPYRFSGETWCSCILLVLLASFDDPTYYFHVKNPNLFSYLFAEFGVAAFVAGLLISWLRSIARHRSKELEPEATRMMRFVHK